MASEFIGSTVLITVNSPPNAQLRGIVQDLQDRVLFLRDVFWLQSRTYMPNFQVPGTLLVDLEVIPNENEDFRPSPLISVPSPNPALAEAELRQQPALVDPAILSFAKPAPKSVQRSDTIASATLTEPFSNLGINSTRPTTSELDTTEFVETKTVKQSVDLPKQVSSPVQQAFQDLMARTLQTSTNNAPLLRVQHAENTRAEQVSTDEQQRTISTADRRKAGKARGRRQRDVADTDMLKVSETAPRKVRKSASRKHHARTLEAQNGWATEEATDIQELGDFDFAANLSKFDKREIFKQLKADDTVAASDRLVAHNRLPKPGTAGGRNLHWTENVLDSPQDDHELWNSEAGETADDFEKPLDSGRSSARQKSHSRTRMAASRKGSHTVDDPGRKQSAATVRQASFEKAQSPRIGTRKNFPSPYLGTAPAAPRSSLRLAETNKPCPLISPVQMLELEQYAIAELGLNEDILSENAARGIAEVATQMHLAQEQLTLRDVRLVVIVGNHKTGSRTLAAARHLRNRGFKTTAVVMGREEDVLDTIRQQSNAFVRTGGVLIKPADLLQEFQTGLQPTLLIDALTGMHISFEDLRREDQQWCFEVAIWADRLNTRVLSVDVPSGIDPSTGAVGVANGHALAFHPDAIVALGAPKSYLPLFLEQADPAPRSYVADLSLGRNAWKRMGGRRRTGVEFGTKWLVELTLQAAS